MDMALSWRGGVRVVLPPLCVYVVDAALNRQPFAYAKPR
jgi:hypothetical protein